MPETMWRCQCGNDNYIEQGVCDSCGAARGVQLEQPLDSVDEINRCFTYQKPDQEQVMEFGLLHQKLLDLGQQILRSCPESGDRERAFDSLRQCRMWANSAIAHRGRY